MVTIDRETYSSWQTYPYDCVYVNQNPIRDLLSVHAQKLEISGKILSIKGKIFKIELDINSLHLVLRVSKAVNSSLSNEIGKTLQSTNVFGSNVLRFRRRDGTSNYKNFEDLIGTSVKITIRPENIYQGKHYSLNWICESF